MLPGAKEFRCLMISIETAGGWMSKGFERGLQKEWAPLIVVVIMEHVLVLIKIQLPLMVSYS